MSAQEISDGVIKVILKESAGQRPRAGDEITVHCTGSLVNPLFKFWSTKDAGQKPFSFKVGLGKVIKGWDEGCLTMSKGESARFLLQPHKAYGAGGFPAWKIPPNAPLQFDIELLKINGS